MDNIVHKGAIKGFLAPEPKTTPNSASTPPAKSASKSASQYEDENSMDEVFEDESSVYNSSASSFEDEAYAKTSRTAKLTKNVPRSRGERSAATSISGSPQSLKKIKGLQLQQRMGGLEAALASTQTEFSKTKTQLANSDIGHSKRLKATTKILLDKEE
ncbi:hypothetical protein PF005_g3742 [Phytophthora fragariae]|uniref:Uncharacterized protein n=1 Tax=Phytophthora fragariae TaxID=53985 RepID=A0A6A3FNG2_9STRA|nr:hypothetical protein PF003_g39038 [Phytophthora fragariae]KAE8947585.1 hypothetical protein PF009_g2815 [Phytophthora fragariae]KAE9024970.1 hypothetical protein PF011_g3245 [Phytophthora fragariae]KAE9131643.1 hypothetical protein PF010_g3463 [Phytophthora fragariae]KAE9132924.1 hypothetical protein PF007_g3536 [Phytophthora fragariae]